VILFIETVYLLRPEHEVMRNTFLSRFRGRRAGLTKRSLSVARVFSVEVLTSSGFEFDEVLGARPPLACNRYLHWE
jgi:hypothetical protein